MNTVAIFNPRAGGGKTAEAWARARAHLRGDIEALETKGRGHAIELATNAIKSGAGTIIAVGGDGTISEVVNGLFENEQMISREVTLGIIPHGTSSDFRRILNLPVDSEKAAAVIQNGETRMVDVLLVRYTRMDGTPAFRYCLNVTSFGMGGAVAARVNRSSKPLGGKIAFITATVRTALGFSGIPVRLELDDSQIIEAGITNVAICNGQYHGAGMWISPRASIDDGMIDVTVIRHVSLFDLVKSLPILYNGRIYSHPKIEAHRVKRVKADSKEPALIEIDGEPLGRLPIETSILPKTLRLLTPSARAGSARA
jgi:YegS/Rv2252/BmrU family lipid kinase